MANKIGIMKSPDGRKVFLPRTLTSLVKDATGKTLDSILSDISDEIHSVYVLTSEEKSALKYIVENIASIKRLVGLGISFNPKTETLVISGKAYNLKEGGSGNADDDNDPIVKYEVPVVEFGYAKTSFTSQGVSGLLPDKFTVKQTARTSSGSMVQLQYNSLQEAVDAGATVSFRIASVSGMATVNQTTGALTINVNDTTSSRSIVVEVGVTLNNQTVEQKPTVTLVQSGVVITGTVTAEKTVTYPRSSKGYKVMVTTATNGVNNTPAVEKSVTNVVGSDGNGVYRTCMDLGSDGKPHVYVAASVANPVSGAIKVNEIDGSEPGTASGYYTPNGYRITCCVLTDFIDLRGMDNKTKAKTLSLYAYNHGPQAFFFKNNNEDLSGYVSSLMLPVDYISSTTKLVLENQQIPADANFVRLNVYKPSSESSTSADDYYKAIIKFE